MEQVKEVFAREYDTVLLPDLKTRFGGMFTEGLQFECEQGRDLGFDGKSLIHPAQIDLANQVFAPSVSEIALAQRQIEAFKQASDAGQGVAVVDGTIVENLHVETAQRLLDQAQVIAEQAAIEQAGTR